jgi:hypothetical protein
MSSNPSNAPGSSVSVEQLEQTAQAIAQKLDALRAEQRSLRSVMILGSLLLICTMLVFGWKLYSTGRDNFSEEKVRMAFEASKGNVTTELQSRAHTLYKELYPVYLKAATERWDSVRPKLEAKFASEAAAFPVELQKHVTDDINAAFTRVQTSTQKTFDKELPSLSVERMGDVHELIKDSIVKEADKLHDRMGKVFSMEQGRFEKILKKFPVPDATNANRNALQKEFLHELIQLLDHEIFVYGTPEGLDIEHIKMELNVGNAEAPVTGSDGPTSPK